jgi:hypothetical protein
MSKGAPFSICETNLPDELNDNFAVCPVVFSNSAAISVIGFVKFDATATSVVWAFAKAVNKTKENVIIKRIHSPQKRNILCT